jgi:signal transduction histidine kinase
MKTTKLTVHGPEGDQEIRIEPKGVTLGRAAHCDVVLDDENVSRTHARISQDPFGRWIVEDMDSRNGVFVDGLRAKAQTVQMGQTVTIRPFRIVLTDDATQDTAVQPQSSIPIVDKGAEEHIVSYRSDQATILSPALMHHLNELTARLVRLSSPAELYAEASSSLAEMLDTLVAVVRLPGRSQPLPKSPDVLALHFGTAGSDPALLQTSYIHFSRRVLEAVRTTDSPIMAGGKQPSSDGLMLTVVDKHRPHLVFAGQVNDLGDALDALYIDIPEGKSPSHMFDFVEAVARQINFAQKALFLAELQKQDKALREANAQLKQKDRIKDEYVSRVTHDIKGHLAAITNCLHVANDTSSHPLSELQANFLGRAINRTQQVTEFVKELLNLTQMRLSGRFDVSPFSLPETIAKALAAVENKAQDKSITVTSEIDPSVGDIVGNEFSIGEMISNLLFNAAKYTPEGKSIHLAAATGDGHVQVAVSDTGIGIPADEVDHVFDEFFRASNVAQSPTEGTGLGLSIVKQIVDRHGGEISVTSEEGQGTTFTVRLPTASR